MASIGALGWLMAGSSLLQGLGALEGGRQARIAGERSRVMAEFNARQAEREAGEVIAISQRQAMEQRRQGNMLASRALAVAAASGGGASDPTIVNLIANTQGEAAYRASVALYEGEAKARQLRLDAIAGRVSGWEAQAEGARREGGATLSAFGSFAKGAASLFSKYGMNGPKSGDDALIRQDTRSAQYPDF